MSAFAGCGKGNQPLPYHATSVVATIKDSFLYAEENRIKFAYPNESYDPDDPDSEEYFLDKSLPSYRVIMITEQELLNDAFDDVPVVDFETKMVLIIIYSAIGSYQTKLKNVEKKNDILEITIKKNQTGMATAPYLVYEVVQLVKLNISDVVVFFTK